MLLGAAQGTFWMPPEASNFAAPVDQLFYLIYWVSLVMFVGIVAVMLYFAWKYRRREGHESEKTPTHHTVLELTWSVPPLFLVLWFFWVGFEDYQDMVTPPADAYEIQVTARAYGWSFSYPNGGTSGELLLPDDRPVKLTMTSTDYLHSFFVPAFRVKQDLVPGRYTRLWFKPLPVQLEGDQEYVEYNLYCTEYCGARDNADYQNQLTDWKEAGEPEGEKPDPGQGHYSMHAPVKVMSGPRFDKLVADLALPSDPLEAGKMVYKAQGCNACHSVDGSQGVGPTWKGLWGSERTFVDGSSTTADENYIAESIRNPNAKIVSTHPNGGMAAFQLKPRELEGIIAYIKSLSDQEEAD